MSDGPGQKSKPRKKTSKSKFIARPPQQEPERPQTPLDERVFKSLGFNDTTIKLLHNVDEGIAEVVKQSKEMMIAAGINIEFQITQGFRTPEQQYAAYKRGKSPLNGYTSKSNHQSGNAIDYSAYVNGKYIKQGDAPQYKVVAQIFKIAAQKIGAPLVWGGDYKDQPPDWDHIEVVGKSPKKSAEHPKRSYAQKDTSPPKRRELVKTPEIVQAFIDQTPRIKIFDFKP
ncbi:MAG: M15 family metallopeptidase [Alphaproteobacteria bacterium]